MSHRKWRGINRVSSGYGHDRSASFKVGTGSKIGTVVMTMVPNMGFGNPNYEELFFRSVIRLSDKSIDSLFFLHMNIPSKKRL